MLTRMPEVNAGKCGVIGIIVHKNFDSHPIDVPITFLRGIFIENQHNNPKYIIYSNDTRINHHINKCIETWKPEYEWLSDDRYNYNQLTKFEKCRSDEFYKLKAYNEIVDVYKANAVYIFTDTHKILDVNTFINSRSQVVDIITIDSHGDYINHSNSSDPRNHRQYFGGMSHNENAYISKEFYKGWQKRETQREDLGTGVNEQIFWKRR